MLQNRCGHPVVSGIVLVENMIHSLSCSSQQEHAYLVNQNSFRKKHFLPAPPHAKAYNRMRKKIINDVNIKRLLIYYNTGPQVD